MDQRRKRVHHLCVSAKSPASSNRRVGDNRLPGPPPVARSQSVPNPGVSLRRPHCLPEKRFPGPTARCR